MAKLYKSSIPSFFFFNLLQGRLFLWGCLAVNFWLLRRRGKKISSEETNAAMVKCDLKVSIA